MDIAEIGVCPIFAESMEVVVYGFLLESSMHFVQSISSALVLTGREKMSALLAGVGALKLSEWYW